VPDAGSPAWTRTGPGLTCAGCHQLPPPPPHAGATQCGLCHPNATGSDGLTVVNAALHVNGKVEVAVPQACDGCHGSAANPAPPRDTRGNTATSLPSVGAHQAHLLGTGFSRRPACGDCHPARAAALSPGHNDGVVQLAFSGVALTGGSTPSYAQGSCASVWCHDTRPVTGLPSNGGLFQTPDWTRLDGEQIKCDGCHGNPPSAPHPQQSNCGACHSTMDGGTIAMPARHVDGVLDF
jgi:predicted CxxxxCH...CXXCH cytochrome family protein